MPNAFDVGKYSANFNPLQGFGVSIQDVMLAFGDVFQEVINLLPQLVTALERLSTQDLIQLIETGLTAFVDLIFPPDGSVSPLITGLVSVLTNVATSGAIWGQIVDLVIQLGPQLFLGMENVIAGGTGTSLLGSLITLAATVLTSNTALLQGFTTAVPVLQQLISAGGGTGSTLTDFGGLFTALSSIAVSGITGLATGIGSWLASGGALPSSTLLGAGQLSGLASGLASWLTGGGALPSATTLGASGLTGLATGLGSWLTGGGALPAGISLGGSQLTGSVAAALISGVLNPANIPALAISAITGLGGYLANLSPAGLLGLAGLASGTLPGGINLPAGQLVSLATGIGSWLTGGGALPSATSLGAGQLSGLATGLGSWLTGGGALPSATSLGAGQLTGLATGLASWLTGGGALPGGITLGGGQLTGSVASSLLSGTIAAGLLPTITAAMTSGLATVDQVINGLTGGTSTGNTVAQMLTTLGSFSHTNVQGVFGQADIGQSVTTFADIIQQAIHNDTTLTNQSLASVQASINNAIFNFLGYNTSGTPAAGSVAAQSNTNNANLANRAVQKDVNDNIDRSMSATFDFKEVYTQTTLPTIAVTQANPVSAPINIRDGGQKQSIVWKGFLTGTLTGFYVNLYHVSPTTGAWTWFYTTTNYAASLATGTTPQYNFFNLPAVSYINTTQGDLIQAEITVVGSGTYNLVGKTLSNQLLPMAGVFPSMPAAQRATTTNPPAFISSGATTVGLTTWTETVPTTANAAYVVFSVQGNSTGASAPAVTLGGQTMTNLGVVGQYHSVSATANWCIFVARLFNPPTGTQTLSTTTPNWGANVYSSKVFYFSGVAGEGTIQNGSGAGNALSMTSAAVPQGQILFNVLAMAAGSSGNALTSYNQTQLANFAATAGGAKVWVAGTAASTGAAITFSASGAGVPGNYQQWGGSIIPLVGFLQPAPATVANPLAPGTVQTTANPVAYNRLQPWIGLSGAAGMTTYQPQVVSYTSSQTITNPTVTYPWANSFDVEIAPGGGGGCAGGAVNGQYASPGTGWTKATLTKAQMGSSNLTYTQGAGGNGGASTGAPGSSGGASSLVIPGYGTINSPAGGAGSASTGTASPAPGMVSDTYNGTNYPGGQGGASPQAAGAQPGGAGAGGNATWVGSFIFGGPGGPGILWIKAIQ